MSGRPLQPDDGRHPANEEALEGMDAVEADLLEALLNPGTVAPPRTDARLATSSAELESFLDTCRTTFSTEDERDLVGTRRLSERILARTTREDLSWRGDLALVGGFLRKRLGESVALRLVAASLLVHLIAAPSLLAYYMLVKPAREVNLSFEMPQRAPERVEEEPDRPIVAPPLDPEGLDLDADAPGDEGR